MSSPRTRRRLASALLGVAAVTVLPSGGTPALAATAAGTASPSILATTGTDAHLYYRKVSATSWTDLGGRLVDAPAYDEDAAGGFFFVGTGTDRNVYVRTLTQGWKSFGPAGTDCFGPSVAYRASDHTLAVSCIGADSRFLTASVKVPTSGLPRATAWTDKGGSFLYGSSTVYDTGNFQYNGVGSNSRVYTAYGTGRFRFSGSPLVCSGPLPMDLPFACRDAGGGLQVIDQSDYTAKVIRGGIVGRPGVSFGADQYLRYYVLGTNDRVYSATQVAYGDTAGTTSGFSRTGSGLGKYGIAAGAGDGNGIGGNG